MTTFLRNSIRRSQKGFTLIELTLVSVLIMIMINISIPLFRGTYHRVRIESSCRDLCQLMRYLQTRSVVEGVRYRLHIDFGEGLYWAESQVRSGFGGEGFEPLTESIGGRHRVREGLSVEGDSEVITFYPDGRCDKAEFRIKDRSGIAYAIRVRSSDIRIEAIGEGPG